MIDAQGYGKALFELAQENKNEKQVRDELMLVGEILRQNPEYINLMDTPAVSSKEKLELLSAAFAGVDGMVSNFLSILSEKRSFYRFSACAQAYFAAFDEAHEILRATAITAVAMTKKQCTALQKKLSALTGKKVELSNRIDPSVIGGVTLRYAGVQIDDSIQTRLETLRRTLAETIV